MVEIILCLAVIIFIIWLFGFQIPEWVIRWSIIFVSIFTVVYLAMRLAIHTSGG